MKSVNERYLTLKCSNTAAGCIARLVAAPLKSDDVITLDEDHFHKRNNKKYMIKPDVPEAGLQIIAWATWLANPRLTLIDRK